MAEFRYWRNEDRMYLKDVIPLDAPFNLSITSSTLCNAKCIYCAHSQKFNVYEGNMPMELFEKIIQDIHGFPHKIKKFDMHNFGEPLCNPALAKMIAYAKAADVVEKIDFTTNGLLFTPQRVDEIISAGVDTIRISLQGLDAATYRRICGITIDFEKFIGHLKYLYQNRGNCKIRMKIPDIVVKEIPDGQKKLENIFGEISDSLFIENILPIFSGIDYDNIDTSINKNAGAGRCYIQQNEMHKVCHRPFFKLNICPDGDVTAACCDATKDIIYGNIYKESLTEIWNGPKHRAFLKMQLQGKRFLHPYCKDCTLPNDIADEKDILDPYVADLLARF